MSVKITGTGTVDASLESEVMGASGVFGKSGMQLLPEGTVPESPEVVSWRRMVEREEALLPTLSSEELKQEMRYNSCNLQMSDNEYTPLQFASEDELARNYLDIEKDVYDIKNKARKASAYSIQKTQNGSQIEQYSHNGESVFVLTRNDGETFTLNNMDTWNKYRTLEEDGSIRIAFPTTNGVITKHNYEGAAFFDVTQCQPTDRQPLSSSVNAKKGFIAAAFNPDGKIQVLAIKGQTSDHEWMVKMPNEISEQDKSAHLKAMSKMEQGQEGYRLQDMVEKSPSSPKQQLGRIF